MDYILNHDFLTINEIGKIITGNYKIHLSKEVEEKVIRCRKYLDDKVSRSEKPIYGINTGFGSLCDTEIPKTELSLLQENLVRSHSCGMGDEVPKDIVKLMILLKIQSLSYGHSGISIEVINRLVDMYNNDVIPVIYQQGSLGASGDLAPLAHLSLPIIGEGEVYYQEKKMNSSDLNIKLGWSPIKLQSKEGLALLNGTQFMSAYGVWILTQSIKYSKLADIIAAASLEGADGIISPFEPFTHEIRPHKGQLETAKTIYNIVKDSEIVNREKEYIQDPYSYRCTPQVHGASKDMIDYVKGVFETEINSVTDNPKIFPDEDRIISAGNFHGQPLAIALDSLCLALAELGSISQTRAYRLLFGERELPAFLVANPGLNSGFMIVQYTMASIVSQNKQYCTPAVVDSLESSNGQEDHVSMGANAATKAYKILLNIESILSSELFIALQAVDFRKQKPSPLISSIKKDFRKSIPFIENDQIMYIHMEEAKKYIRNEMAKFLNS